MPSQQAEKDAVDTLLFMSSPNHSGRAPRPGAEAGAERERLDVVAPQRRVMFEGFLPGEREGGRRRGEAAGGQGRAAYYRAEPSR